MTREDIETLVLERRRREKIIVAEVVLLFMGISMVGVILLFLVNLLCY